jgi:hypothetical protein
VCCFGLPINNTYLCCTDLRHSQWKGIKMLIFPAKSIILCNFFTSCSGSCRQHQHASFCTPAVLKRCMSSCLILSSAAVTFSTKANSSFKSDHEFPPWILLPTHTKLLTS